MLIRISGSQLLIFPTYKTLSYHGITEGLSKPRLFNIKIMECEKDLGNFDYMGKVTGDDELTILVSNSHYQDLINLHLSKGKPDKMYIKFNKKFVSYYGFSC